MKARKLIVTAVGLLGIGIAVADDGVLVFLLEGEPISSLSHGELCVFAGVPGYDPFQAVFELLSPEDGDIEGTLTVCGNTRRLFRQDSFGEDFFTGRWHDKGEMVFELDDETIRIPYTGIDASSFDLGSFLIPLAFGGNFFTETIVVVEEPGSSPSLRFGAVFEGFSKPIVRGSVVLGLGDDDD